MLWHPTSICPSDMSCSWQIVLSERMIPYIPTILLLKELWSSGYPGTTFTTIRRPFWFLPSTVNAEVSVSTPKEPSETSIAYLPQMVAAKVSYYQKGSDFPLPIRRPRVHFVIGEKDPAVPEAWGCWGCELRLIIASVHFSICGSPDCILMGRQYPAPNSI